MTCHQVTFKQVVAIKEASADASFIITEHQVKCPVNVWPSFLLKCVFYFRPKAKGMGHLDFWNLLTGSFPY